MPPRTHPRPPKWNRFSPQTTLPGFQSPVNSFFLHFVPSMILLHLTSTPKPFPHTSCKCQGGMTKKGDEGKDGKKMG